MGLQEKPPHEQEKLWPPQQVTQTQAGDSQVIWGKKKIKNNKDRKRHIKIQKRE